MKRLVRFVITIIIIALILSFIIDYALVILRDTEPLFIFKEDNNTKYSLIYKIEYLDDKVKFYIFNYKIKEKEYFKNKPEIIKKSDVCLEESNYFYEDEKYFYYLDCDYKYYVKVGNVEYTLKNAIDNKLISLEDLKNNNIGFRQEEKTLVN